MMNIDDNVNESTTQMNNSTAGDAVESVQAEMVKTETVQSEPVLAEPVKTEPVHMKPVQTEPIQAEPIHMKTMQTEPIESEPIQMQTVQAESVQVERLESVYPQNQAVQSPVKNEKKKSSDIPVIIVSLVAALAIGALLFFGINKLNDKDQVISQKEQELAEKQQELEGKISELASKEKELEQKKDELSRSEEQKNLVIAERDELIKAEEERLRAEADTSAADDAEKEAISQMQAVIAKADAALIEMDNIDLSSSAEAVCDQIEVIYTKFWGYMEEFDSLKNVPKNFLLAGSEYMDLVDDYISEARDLYWFVVDYLETVEKIGEYGDSLKNAEDSLEFAIVSVDKIDAIISSIDSTRCPDYYMPLWNRWKETVNMMHDFTYRMVEGMEINDSLRMNSGLNLIERIKMILSNLIDEMTELLNDESDFTQQQRDNAGLIKAEIDTAAELDYAERSSYYFENTFFGEVNLNYRTIDEIYPSLYNSYNYFVLVEAGCVSGNKEIVIECEIPGLTEKFEEKYRIDSHIMPIYIRPIAAKNISGLENAWDSTIKVTIRDLNGKLIDAKSFPVHILSENDFKWNDDAFGVCTQDNILCFIAPESEAITKLKRDAIDVLDELTDGEMNSFLGYQGVTYSEYVDTYLKAMALMIAMSNAGVRYNFDTFSIDGADQHILFPSQVMDNKSGLCIETSLVIASALQSAEMHTYLVFPPGHAQVALEVWEGAGEYFLIETTCLPNEWSDYEDYVGELFYGSYDNSGSCPIIYLNNEEWKEYIEQGDVYLVDCSDGKLLGLTPFAR